MKFFNHAASLNPKVVAFILPRTFMKQRFWDRLDSGYSLVEELACGSSSFSLDGKPYNVPCVGQIWERAGREVCLPKDLVLFSECNSQHINAVFIRRAGGRAGQIVDRADYNPASTYSVLCSEETKKAIIRFKDKIAEQASKTVGVRSITILEIEDILLGSYEV